MCILLVLRDQVEGWPLVVGANRDEFRDRLFVPPLAEGPVLAPRDLRAGGTWLALHRAGVLVAVTNLPEAAPDPARASRGLLALSMARAGSVNPHFSPGVRSVQAHLARHAALRRTDGLHLPEPLS
jgi:uncharacterized protein with NRDE domain